jgi:hypothetical protein
MGSVSVKVRVKDWDGRANDLVKSSVVCVPPSCVTQNTSTEECGTRHEGGPDCTGVAAGRVVTVWLCTTDGQLWKS